VLKAKVAKEDKTWAKYFASIRGVCPWSYNLMDKILVLDAHVNCMNTWSTIFKASNYEAFVYKFPRAKAQWLINKCEELNASQEHSEWLWSHPDEDSGDNTSTHIPVLIQQDREQLTDLRKKVGYTDG
jgi:hypothetical protein